MSKGDLRMKYVYFLENGTMVDVLPENYDKFYIAEDVEAFSSLSRYYYPGDDIQYTIDSLCVELYDAFQDAIFPSRDDFYKDYEVQPQWISRAGLDSDFNMPKDELVTCFEDPMHDRMAKLGITNESLLRVYEEIDSKKFRYAYTADCQSLINTLQELIMGCHSSFVGFYKHLCMPRNTPQMEGVYFECSTETRITFSFLYNVIIQCYSVFDVLTKIAYELEHIKTCNDSYAKLASSSILYGNRKSLSIDIIDTVFEKCRTTSIIENLRNELVHNATWEMNPKVFIAAKGTQILERYIFMPDFTTEGTLTTYKNRKRFFADGKKVNEELPILYFDVMHRVRATLQLLICNSKSVSVHQ